jgi:endonuclease III
MHPRKRAAALLEAARLARERDPDESAALPLREATRALQRFPGLGAPGAERVLLLAGAHPVLALDSNGLRALVRLGFAVEQPSYAATYRAVREALELPDDVAWLRRAHLLLRQHGRETCKRTRPRCDGCALARRCPAATGPSTRRVGSGA